MGYMSDQVYKDLGAKLEVSASKWKSVDLKGAFSTQDIGTARLVFPLSKERGDLTLDTVEAHIYLSGDGLKSESRADIDTSNNIVTYVLSDEEIKHAGTIVAELYLNYENGQKLSAHKFQFKIDRALKDQDIEITESVYNVTIDDLIATYTDKFEQLMSELSRQQTKYSDLQVELVSSSFEKLRMGQAVKILCYGDSLTYGYDIYSADKRPADSIPTSNGTKHIRERASTTYPEALESAVKQVYPNVSVQNWGYSGDTVLTSYSHWNGVNPNAEITLMMLGHNDSKSATESMHDFIAGYKKIIERALDWGSAIILLTPPKQKNGADFTVDTYSQAVMQLAKEYHAPLIDMAELTAGISADCYSDSVHFNGKGYDYIGKKLASIFINKSILNMNKVKDHDSLTVTRENSGIQFNENCSYSTSEYFPTEDSVELGKGNALVLKTGGKVYFSFYSQEDNLLFLPSIYAGSKTLNLKMEVNFSAEPANTAITYAFNTTNARAMNKPLKTATFTTTDLNWFSASALYIDGRINASKLLYAPRKGYYTVSIENLDTYGINLFGLEFRNARTALFDNNTLYTLGTFTGDILTLSAGNYEMYSKNALNMPFTEDGLAILEIYVGGSNRKLFKVTNITTKASYEGVYNPAASSSITWKELASVAWTNAQIIASKN